MMTNREEFLRWAVAQPLCAIEAALENLNEKVVAELVCMEPAPGTLLFDVVGLATIEASKRFAKGVLDA